jgi:hypothetical protein
MRRRLTWLLLVLAIVGVAIATDCIRNRRAHLAVERAADGLHSILRGIRLEKTPFEGALAELGRQSGLRLAPRWDLLRQAGIDPNTPVTIDIPRGSARAALADLLDCGSQGRAQVEFFIDEPGAVVITTGADYRARAFVSRSYDISALMPASGDKRAAQGVIADMVRRLIDTRPPAGAAPHEVSVEAVAGRLAVVADREMQLLIDPFLRDRNAAQVKTMARLAGLTVAGARSWSDQPLSAVLQQLSREFDVGIAPDWATLHQAWVEPDVPISLRSWNINAGKLLNICVDSSRFRQPSAVGWSVDPGGTVIVTTQRQIDRADYSVRVYDLYPITRSWPAEPWKRRELTRALVLLIEETVAPESWPLRGGEAWARVDGGRLYIRETSEAHRQTTGLIDQLFKSHRLPRFRGSEPVPEDADFIPAAQSWRR